MSRREFTNIVMTFLGSIMGAIIGLPIIGYIISPAVKEKKTEDWISLGPPENYPIGVPTLFTFTRSKVNGWEKTTNSYGVYVLRKSDNEITTFSNVCTHLSCRVRWIGDDNAYACPCHDAKFDIDGGIIYGPQPRPLDEYVHKIEDGDLLIHLVLG